MKTKQLTSMAFGIVLLVICAQIAIPLPGGVPFTLQLLGLITIGYLYPPQMSFKITLVYLLMGILGFPVFANFSAGFAAFFGPTGGFLWAFPFVAFCISNDKHQPMKASFLSMFILYSIGLLQFMWVTQMAFTEAFMICIVPFILFDCMKYLVGYLIYQRVPKMGISHQTVLN